MLCELTPGSRFMWTPHRYWRAIALVRAWTAKRVIRFLTSPGALVNAPEKTCAQPVEAWSYGTLSFATSPGTRRHRHGAQPPTSKPPRQGNSLSSTCTLGLPRGGGHRDYCGF